MTPSAAQAADGAAVAGAALGVLVPCRNEAAVIARKLANLARCRWPASARPHRLVVVDDGSTDGTRERARAALAEVGLPAGVRAEVLASSGPGGKPGAIAAGLAALGAGGTRGAAGLAVDLVVLTDADVVLELDALAALASAFAADPGLALACGAQRFVPALPADGSLPAEDLARSSPVATLYDRFSEAVRRLESRRGLCFSVHGQLLAWRADLGLAPAPAVAADDLDLVLAVRARASEPRGVRLVDGARFFETKVPPGAEADAQALRRARAYVQAVGRARPLARGGLLARAQELAYRGLVPRALELTLAATAAAVALAALAGGALAAVLAALALLGAALTAPGARWLRLALLIRRAVRAEAAGTLSDRWDTARS